MRMSLRASGSPPARLPEASTIGNPRPLLPTRGAGYCCEVGITATSEGENEREPAAESVPAPTPSALELVMLVAASAMNDGVGMYLGAGPLRTSTVWPGPV